MNYFKGNTVDDLGFIDYRERVEVTPKGKVLEIPNKEYPAKPVKTFSVSEIKALEDKMRKEGKL